ncbi:hypothetical protein RRF57_000856 [Xylaria bambusicola]|uniref:Uncharacterized protein n=1 Tax=Xylaria bambusicola TaxID=326684 RepID=A0AAN7U456_9PEZI
MPALLSAPRTVMNEDDYSDYEDDSFTYAEYEGFPPRPQSPEPVKSGAFSYDTKNGLRVGNFSRASLEDLSLLFRKNASSARRAVATKPWLTAQLRLYDINFNKSAKVSELRSTLEAAVKGRKCVEGPPSIDLIKQRLAAQFARKQEEYAQAIKTHKLDVKKWHRENFSKLDDPSAEARYDLGWFISKYFVNDDGSPAPKKTPEPVIIWDVNDSESLHRRIYKIPGLRARITDYLAVIAWDSAFKRGIGNAFSMIDRPDVKVNHPTLEALFDPELFLAKYFLDGWHGRPNHEKQKPLTLESWFAYSNGIEKLKQAANHVPGLLIQEATRPSDNSWQRDENCIIVGWGKGVEKQVKSWKSEIARLKNLDIEQKKLSEEKEIRAKLKPHTDFIREKRSLPSGPFTLNHLVGSYMVQCRLLEEEYMCQGSMTLDIHAPTSTHGAVGAFDFGILEGTMLISTSKTSLERLREEEAACSDSENDEVSDLEPLTVSGKRKLKDSQGPSTKHPKRRPSDIENSQNTKRFYLLWAGLETGTAELVLDADHERTGYFELDSTGTTAQGQFFYRGLLGDEPVAFTLLKTADEPRKRPDAWSSYCEEARWRHW